MIKTFEDTGKEISEILYSKLVKIETLTAGMGFVVNSSQGTYTIYKTNELEFLFDLGKENIIKCFKSMKLDKRHTAVKNEFIRIFK